jgi:hypothetical protein
MLLSLIACSPNRAESPGTGKSDMIKLNGILYTAPVYWLDSLSIGESDLTLYATIKRKDRNVYRDGDASLLDAGTPVYSIAGYAPGFRLAVKKGQDVVLYQVSRNPSAKKGVDLLDVGGKVEYIGISKTDSATILATITEQAQIDSLVGMVLDAPVFGSASRTNSGTRVVMLSLRLLDGTEAGGFFWLDSGVLSPPGIQLPGEFGAAIWAAIVAQRESS